MLCGGGGGAVVVCCAFEAEAVVFGACGTVLALMLLLYMTTSYEARILQNGDVPISDTDTPQILADTYP